ncbi:protein SMALL AUXIN UP-REGULATED RNA 12 [Cannabis sativa]|uniref:protein SMALL AUXIN UP-REGULATED RNA 12 n=1 Tax=Cannabis sativa TaxID=3483 RepID=UPI0029CA752F|nr:protein SMALL AUXIN UP-REGULATED RNA 12 [Cannabis sativa]
MLGKKIVSFKKLAKKVKIMGRGGGEKEGSSSSSSSSSSPFSLSSEYHESLLREFEEEEEEDEIPTGFLAVYVGEERQRFVVPTTFLSHPLFKMLLEKAYEEFGFQQRNGLVVPCSVSSFRDVVNAVQCSNGMFDFGKLVEELL